MNRILSAAVMIVFAACSQPNTGYKIEGRVTADVKDGQKIYLVPMEHANAGNVDSTFVKEGKFTFEGDTERVAVIRLPMLQRLDAQELLVVTEPGTTQVTYGRNSSAHGTPQNELLQHWKELTITRNRTFSRYMDAQRDSAAQAETGKLKIAADAANQAFEQYTRKVVRSHPGTTVQQFLTRLTGIR